MLPHPALSIRKHGGSTMSFISSNKHPESCPYAQYERGVAEGEPSGYICTLSRSLDGCTAPDGECPTVQRVAVNCPRCFLHGKYTPYIYHDEAEDLYGCDCGARWWPGGFESEWKEVSALLSPSQTDKQRMNKNVIPKSTKKESQVAYGPDRAKRVG